MKRDLVNPVVGIALVLVGGFLLLQNLGVITPEPEVFSVLFGLGGAVFVYVFVVNRKNWWALIPGLTLIGLAGLIVWDSFVPAAEGWAVSFLLGSIALAFLVIYLNDREHWWAIIPAGVMLTNAVMAGLLSGTTQIHEASGIFFLGLALTFAVLGILPTPHGRQKWALIPAVILLFVGVLFFAVLAEMMAYVWPVALILGGLWFITRMLIPPRRL
jgi:hypothetical protein